MKKHKHTWVRVGDGTPRDPGHWSLGNRMLFRDSCVCGTMRDKIVHQGTIFGRYEDYSEYYRLNFQGDRIGVKKKFHLVAERRTK